MMRFLRTHLAWKVFLTYVAVVLVGVIVLAASTHFTVPEAYNNHMVGMNGMMTGGSVMTISPADLFVNYQAAVTEAITLAAIAALAAAVIASFLISRQVVEPVRKMMAISRLVAAGDFQKRLNLSGNVDFGSV